MFGIFGYSANNSNDSTMKKKFYTYYKLIGITFLVLHSCSKSTMLPPSGVSNISFQATLNGASATPANASKATGTATFSYNPTTYILSGTVVYQGMTPNGAHIHQGAIGVGGVVVFVLASGTITSPITFTSTPLNASERADLLANLYYINLHSIAYPDGEIRGQLIQQTP